MATLQSNDTCHGQQDHGMSCYSWLSKSHNKYYNIQSTKWMSWGKFHTFTLVVNYINKSGVPCHIITGIFEVQKIIKTNMVLQLKDLLFHLNLCDKVIAYVKDKGTNLNILTNSLTIIVSCVPLMLPQPYDICWQMLSKCYWWCESFSMREILIKDAQTSL